MFQRLWIVLSQSPMLPSLIVLFICTSYKDVKVFHPHRWLDYMRSVLFRRTPSTEYNDKFLPLGKMSGFSSSHVPFSFFLDSRDKCFDSESLILSRFSFFSSRIIWWPSVTLLWWRHTCTTTKILWNLANFQKCLFFEPWREYMYWGRVYHVYCYVYSSILIVWNKVKKKIRT